MKTTTNTGFSDDDAIGGFFAKMAAYDDRRHLALSNGRPALHRLLAVAHNQTGQGATVRALLLGLYNGHRFPFDLTRLRGLDLNLFDDCMTVVTMDAVATVREIHNYVKNGSQVFESWAQMAMQEDA